MIKKRVAVFASGQGSNFQVILSNIKTGFLNATIDLCFTNNPEAGVIRIANKNNIPYRVLMPKEFSDNKSYNDAILDELRDLKIDFIVLAGYLKMIGSQIVEKYNNKIINIHPALLPSFGGKGMYGHHVHQAVFDSGVKVSGATVHLVNNQYDSGPIVMQKAVSIINVQSPDEIAEKVLKIEHEIYVQAIKLMLEDKIKVEKNRTCIVGEKD